MNRGQAFFEKHVVPSVEAWRKDPLDESLAMSAAVNLNQMADHFWHAYLTEDPERVYKCKNVKHFRKQLSGQQPNFGLIRDVADAHKHVKLDRPERVVTSAGQTGIRSLGWGEAEYGRGKWGGGKEVVITLDDGEKRHFSAAVDDVYEMWASMLSKGN